MPPLRRSFSAGNDMVNLLVTNGAIAVKETKLLSSKIPSLASGSYAEAVKALKESGFGAGYEGADGEELCLAEERALDKFITEYAPSERERAFLLAPRDFHNALAIVKAKTAGISAEGMFAPEGLYTLGELYAAAEEAEKRVARQIEEGERQKPQAGKVQKILINLKQKVAKNNAVCGVCPELFEAFERAFEISLAGRPLTGARAGALFACAQFGYLKRISSKSRVLKELLAGRADRSNLLAAMRLKGGEFTEDIFLVGGRIPLKEIAAFPTASKEEQLKTASKADLADFCKLLLPCAEKGLPFTQAERELEGFEAEYFYSKRFELSGKQPYLYYAFRRREDVKNARTALVGLNAGLSEGEILSRLKRRQA